MTQIASLPLVSFSMLVGNNEDWLDSWAYVDASGNPISLAGITLVFQMRRTPSDPVPFVSASTTGFINGEPTTGTLTVGGAGGNVVALDIPRSAMLLIATGSYVWEMQGIAEDTVTIGTGIVTVTQGIVR